MPSETRQIIFELREVLGALRDYRARRGEPLPPGQVVELKIDGNDTTGLSATVKIMLASSNRQADFSFSGEVLGAALVFFCINHRIPVSTRAVKRVARFGDSIGLILELNLSVQGLPAVAGRPT